MNLWFVPSDNLSNKDRKDLTLKEIVVFVVIVVVVVVVVGGRGFVNVLQYIQDYRNV